MKGLTFCTLNIEQVPMYLLQDLINIMSELRHKGFTKKTKFLETFLLSQVIAFKPLFLFEMELELKCTWKKKFHN